MFLENLQNMEQRKAFCNLAVEVINADGKQEVKEIVLLQNYIKEMIINNDIALEDTVAFSNVITEGIFKGKLSDKEIDKNLDIFLATSNLIKKSVLFELCALAYSDSSIDTREKELINYIAKKFDFSKELINNMFSIIVSMNNIYKSAIDIVQD